MNNWYFLPISLVRIGDSVVKYSANIVQLVEKSQINTFVITVISCGVGKKGLKGERRVFWMMGNSNACG